MGLWVNNRPSIFDEVTLFSLYVRFFSLVCFLNVLNVAERGGGPPLNGGLRFVGDETFMDPKLLLMMLCVLNETK